MRFCPRLGIPALRTESRSARFALEQSDRLGAMSFSQPARLAAAPRRTFAFGSGLDLARGRGLRVSLGYAGTLADGKPDHALALFARLRFQAEFRPFTALQVPGDGVVRRLRAGRRLPPSSGRGADCLSSPPFHSKPGCATR